jgi:hypothetical protein
MARRRSSIIGWDGRERRAMGQFLSDRYRRGLTGQRLEALIDEEGS